MLKKSFQWSLSKFTSLWSDSLYRNSMYLMASTFVMAFFGFFFWMINTRLYTSEQIGLATTLISVTSLIVSFSLFGYDTALVRFLTAEKNKSDFINTAFTIISIVTIIITLLFIAGLPIFSPKLLFIRNSPVFILSFTVFMIASSLNTVTNSVFISFRNSKYILIINTIMSIVKMISTIFMVAFGAFGIFYSVVIAVNLSAALSLIFIAYLFHIYFQPAIKNEIVQKVWKFSFGNYVAGFMGGLPTMLLPLIILNRLGAKFSAYFYMDMMIASLIYIIPSAISQSLFSEGSHNGTELKKHLIKAVKINFLILVPVILITLFFGKYILLAFGKQYSNEGILLLQLLSVSGIFISINSILGSILKIKHKIKELIIINFIAPLSILGLSYFLISKELLGIGTAWIIGQGVISIVYLFFIKKLI